MNKYKNKSEFEINKAVAERLGYLVQDIDDKSMVGMNSKFHAQYPNTVWVAELDCSTGEQCSAWEQKCFTRIADDAWPIIIENKITIIYLGNECMAVHGFQLNDDQYRDNVADWSLEARDKKPLLAAMIVFLMMQDSKQ